LSDLIIGVATAKFEYSGVIVRYEGDLVIYDFTQLPFSTGISSSLEGQGLFLVGGVMIIPDPIGYGEVTKTIIRYEDGRIYRENDGIDIIEYSKVYWSAPDGKKIKILNERGDFVNIYHWRSQNGEAWFSYKDLVSSVIKGLKKFDPTYLVPGFYGGWDFRGCLGTIIVEHVSL
jgi:hypothetical protein